jgi:hypothetical protein
MILPTLGNIPSWLKVLTAFMALGAWVAYAERAHDTAREADKRSKGIETLLVNQATVYATQCRDGDFDRSVCLSLGYEWNPRTRSGPTTVGPPEDNRGG